MTSYRLRDIHKGIGANPYEIQDAIDDQRMAQAAALDVMNEIQCMDTDAFMDSLPEHFLSPEMEKIMDPIFTRNGASLDAVLNGIRTAYLMGKCQ